jgi:hypothetical protein
MQIATSHVILRQRVRHRAVVERAEQTTFDIHGWCQSISPRKRRCRREEFWIHAKSPMHSSEPDVRSERDIRSRWRMTGNSSLARFWPPVSRQPAQQGQRRISIRCARAKAIVLSVSTASAQPSLRSMPTKLIILNGGGGGSRTRVRNRCQPGVFMLCPVPLVSLPALRADKMRRKLVR